MVRVEPLLEPPSSEGMGAGLPNIWVVWGSLLKTSDVNNRKDRSQVWWYMVLIVQVWWYMVLIVLRRLRQEDGGDSRSARSTQGYHILARCSEHLQNMPLLLKTVQAGTGLQCETGIGPQIREQRTVGDRG